MGSPLLPELTPLPVSFYERHPVEVARDLVGCWLAHECVEGWRAGAIVETEAYSDAVDQDLASHSFRAPTPRNQVMYGPPGRSYVYFIYGNHFCFNAVAHQAQRAGAVLIRALEPKLGIEGMRTARPGHPDRGLCNGPGKLCQALEITKVLYGVGLDGALRLGVGEGFRPEVEASSRIGIRSAAELPWRFTVKGSPWVSRAVTTA